MPQVLIEADAIRSTDAGIDLLHIGHDRVQHTASQGEGRGSITPSSGLKGAAEDALQQNAIGESSGGFLLLGPLKVPFVPGNAPVSRDR